MSYDFTRYATQTTFEDDDVVAEWDDFPPEPHELHERICGPRPPCGCGYIDDIVLRDDENT